MVWTNDKEIKLVTDMQEQDIPTMQRKGFTVVEWGGSEITFNTQNIN